MPTKSSRPSGTFTKSVQLGTTLLRLLDDDAVRRQLVGASDGVRSWAQNRRRALEWSSRRLARIRPTKNLIGHGRLERRVRELFEVAPEFDEIRPELAVELRATETELRRAVTVTKRLSLSKRLRARRQIYKRLNVIEGRLIDVILTPDPPQTDKETS